MTLGNYANTLFIWLQMPIARHFMPSSFPGSAYPVSRHIQNPGVPVTWEVCTHGVTCSATPGRGGFSKPALPARTSWPGCTGHVWRHPRLRTRILQSNCELQLPPPERWAYNRQGFTMWMHELHSWCAIADSSGKHWTPWMWWSAAQCDLTRQQVMKYCLHDVHMWKSSSCSYEIGHPCSAVRKNGTGWLYPSIRGA